MKCPHARSIVMMRTPLLLLEFPDWNSIFFGIGILGCCVLPIPLVVGLFLLGVFVAFILRLFVGVFIILPVGVGSLVVTLLQHLDFCCHGQDSFLFIRWCSPGIVLIQQVVLSVPGDIDEAMNIVKHVRSDPQWCLRDLQLHRGSMCD